MREQGFAIGGWRRHWLICRAGGDLKEINQAPVAFRWKYKLEGLSVV
jgi:hypothetical protein